MTRNLSGTQVRNIGPSWPSCLFLFFRENKFDISCESFARLSSSAVKFPVGMKCQALFSLKNNNIKKKNKMLSAANLFSTLRVNSRDDVSVVWKINRNLSWTVPRRKDILYLTLKAPFRIVAVDMIV